MREANQSAKRNSTIGSDYPCNLRDRVMGKKRRCYENGYCDQCLYNIDHIRSVKHPFARAIDTMTGKCARFLGLGPWYCINCGSRRLLAPVHRRNVENYDPRLAEEFDRESDPGRHEFDRVGNFIHSDHSLKVQVDRENMFTEKYRDNVVEKLMDGKISITEVRNELGISELDVQRWIAKYHSKRIEFTTLALARIHAEMGGNEFEILAEFESRDLPGDVEILDAITLDQNDSTPS